MSKNQQSQQATVVAVEQVTVANAQSLRARRLAAVQVGRAAKYRAGKLAAHQAAHAAWVAKQQELEQQKAFQLAVQQLAAQYGINVNPAQLAPRANSATVVPSSNVVTYEGVAYRPVAAVHAICSANPHLTRKQLIELCVQHGVNQATASTQYQVWRKGN